MVFAVGALHRVFGAPELVLTVAIDPAVASTASQAHKESVAPFNVHSVIIVVVTASVAILPVTTADLVSVGGGGDSENSAQSGEGESGLHGYFCCCLVLFLKRYSKKKTVYGQDPQCSSKVKQREVAIEHFFFLFLSKRGNLDKKEGCE